MGDQMHSHTEPLRVYGRSDTQPHASSASKLEAGECLAERPRYFSFGKTAAATHCTRGRVGLRANMHMMAYNESLLPPVTEPQPFIPYPSY